MDKQEQIPKTNLLLLFDKSGSMRADYGAGEQFSSENGGYGQAAIEWARDICAIIADSDIVFSAETFDTVCNTIVEPQIIRNGGMEENSVLRQFSDITFHGNTNQHQAILRAEERLAQEEGKKYIIMLSDGELDLDDKSDVDTLEEIAERSKFREKCIELTAEREYTIILIGLGQNIGLYDGLEEMSDNIICYNNQVDLEKLKALLLGEVGFTIQSADIKDNTFFIDEDYDKCLIRIECTDKGRLEGGVDKNIPESDYALYYIPEGQDREPLTADDKISIPMATYLYLYTPRQGRYEVDFPGGTIKVDCIKENRIGKVALALLDENENEYTKKEEQGYVRYDLEEEYIGKGDDFNREQITISVRIDTGLPAGATAKFYWKESEDPGGEGDWDVADTDMYKELKNLLPGGKEWRESLYLEAGKSYKCMVVIDTKLQGRCKSNMVFFMIPVEKEPVIEYSLEGKVNQVFPIEEYIKFDYFSAGGELAIVWEGMVLLRDWMKEIPIEKIQIDEEFGICFKEEGDYIVYIKEDDVDKAIVTFYIKGDFLNELKGKIVIAAIVVFGGIGLLIYLKISRKKRKG